MFILIKMRYFYMLFVNVYVMLKNSKHDRILFKIDISKNE